MGRKTKLSPELQQKIVELLRAGNSVKTACACAGISESTYYNWLATKREPYLGFLEAVKKALAEAEAHAVAAVKAAYEHGTWQAAAWFLERRFPDTWARKDRLTYEGGEIVITNAKDILMRRLGVLTAGRSEEGCDLEAERGAGD